MTIVIISYSEGSDGLSKLMEYINEFKLLEKCIKIVIYCEGELQESDHLGNLNTYAGLIHGATNDFGCLT